MISPESQTIEKLYCNGIISMCYAVNARRLAKIMYMERELSTSLMTAESEHFVL